MMISIAIASDHAGFEYKGILKSLLESKGIKVEDFGTHSVDPVDYPDFIRPAAQAVATGRCSHGIVLGGSGNGEAIVANKLRAYGVLYAGMKLLVASRRSTAIAT